MMPIPLLQVSSLSCEKNERFLFRDLNFSLTPGAILQITGANGSGKTTLLKILAGVGRSDTGSLHWQDNISKIYIGHKNSIKPQLTVRENLESTYLWTNNFKSDEISNALQVFNLTSFENKPSHQLSEGQCRRVALARLLLVDAEVWILDEPFTNLDREGIQCCEHIIHQHVMRGGVVVLSSHQALTLTSLDTEHIYL